MIIIQELMYLTNNSCTTLHVEAGSPQGKSPCEQLPPLHMGHTASDIEIEILLHLHSLHDRAKHRGNLAHLREIYTNVVPQLLTKRLCL